MSETSDVTILSTSEDVLKYWFGSNYFEGGNASRNDIEYINSRMPLWFRRADPAFDAVQSGNSDLLTKLQSIHNTAEDWNSTRGVLAKIIVFDQFSRSIHRGTAQAFAYDQLAKESIEYLLSKNWFEEYSAVERMFIVVAMQHCESMDAQTTGLRLDGVTENHEAISNYFKNLKGFHNEHHDAIKQFGRFPGRNDALGRESTPEELEWLASPDCPGWAKSQIKK